MREEDINKSIKAGKLVDKETWEETTSGVLSLFPLLLLCCFLTAALIHDWMNDWPVSFGMIALLIGGSVLLIYGSICLINENKLTKITTDQTAFQNGLIISNIIDENEWRVMHKSKDVIIVNTGIAFGPAGEKVVILFKDKDIFINARYNTHSKIRFPFLQGLSEKIVKEVKDKMKSAAPNTLQADNRGFTNALP